MKNIKFLLISILSLSLLLSSCKNEIEKTEPAKLIGLSLASIQDDYMTSVVNTLSKECKNNGYTLIITNSNGDVENQKIQLRSLLSLGVKSLIFVAPPEDISNELDNFRKVNIPIVNTVSLVSDSTLVDVSIVNNDKQSGVAIAEEINKYLVGGGKYQMLFKTGEKTDYVRNQCLAGLTNTLSASISKYSNPLACVDSVSSVSKAKTILSKDIKVCIAFDDTSIKGFVTALAESEKTLEDVKLIVVSGSPFSKMLLRDGKISTIIALSPVTLAKTAINSCFTLINGQQQEFKILINNSILTPDNIENYNYTIWE